MDIHQLTSNIDLLPTLLLAVKWCNLISKAESLFGWGWSEESRYFSTEAKECSSFGQLGEGVTVAMRKGEHKLIYYTGYPKRPDAFELFNLNDDRDEMKDLFALNTTTSAKMKKYWPDTFESNRKIPS